MKRLFSFIALFLAFVACHRITPDPEPQPEPEPEPVVPVLSPDSTYVSLKAALDFSEEPLTKAGSQDDLYGIRVYQLSPVSSWNAYGINYAAYGTFDDLSKAVIKMAKASKYGIAVTYVPNGKNLVHKFSDGHYGVPFDAVHVDNGTLNQVMYCQAGTPAWDFSYGVVQDKGITDYMIQSNLWSSITRYQGLAICNPESESTVTVNLYAEMIGFRIDVTDFSEGTITLNGDYGHKYTATPDSNGKGLIDIVVCRERMPSFTDGGFLPMDKSENEWITSLYEECDAASMRVYLSYKDKSGDEVTLYTNPAFLTKRNTRYVMSFSLSDAIRNGGITASTVNEGEMTESDFPL